MGYGQGTVKSIGDILKSGYGMEPTFALCQLYVIVLRFDSKVWPVLYRDLGSKKLRKSCIFSSF